MKLTPKQAADLKEVVHIQGQDGNWNFDPYMCGMFNGMELMLAIIENRDPVFRQVKGMPGMEHKFLQGSKQ